jgi:hypothetical protein
MGMFDHCESLEEAVYQAVGAASACWHDDGVFDEQGASEVAEDLLSVIRKWMNDIQNATQSELPMPESVKDEDKRLREEFYNAE